MQRTNEAILNDLGNENPNFTTEIACRKKFLELQKFGVQKARTGAELAVIRELVGMPTGFDKKDVEKGCQMLFSQVIENNTFKVQVLAEVMKTQDGRAAVVQALFGATRSVYGPGATEHLLSPERTQSSSNPNRRPETKTALKPRRKNPRPGRSTRRPAMSSQGRR